MDLIDSAAGGWDEVRPHGAEVTHVATVDYHGYESLPLIRGRRSNRVRFTVSWLRPEVAGDSAAVRLTLLIFLDTVTLRAELAASAPGLDLDAEVARLRQQTIDRALSAFAEVGNVGHRLPSGSPLSFELRFVDDLADDPHVVDLRASGRSNSGSWVVGHPGLEYLHEVLHLTGGWDEYRERTARGTRVVYTDGGIMGGHWEGAADQNRQYPHAGMRPDVRLLPRDLRRLGALVVPAGSRVKAPVESVPVVFADGVLEAALSGTGRRHRPQDAGRRVQGPLNGVANGVYRLAAARDSDRSVSGVAVGAAADDTAVGSAVDGGWMYPVEWTADEVRYHVEQAFLDAARRGQVRDAAEVAGRQRWSGVYNGVRSEGEVRAGEIIWFRPTADQSSIDAPVLHPVLRMPADQRTPRPRPLVSHRTADLLTYGDRASRSGLFHRLPGDLPPGVRVRMAPGTTAHANGTYVAEVAFLDPRIPPLSSRAELEHYWHPPSDGDVAHRMFPDAWTPMQVVDAAVEARALAGAIGAYRRERDGTTTWVGTGRGVRMEGVSDAQGSIIAVRPTPDQPHAAPVEAAKRNPVIALGAGVGLTIRLNNVPERVVTNAVLLADGQIGYHVARRVRLVAAPGTTSQTMAEFRRSLPGPNRFDVTRSDRTTGRPISAGVVEDFHAGSVEIMVHPDGTWSIAGHFQAPLPGLLPVAVAVEQLDPQISRLRADVQPLLVRREFRSWHQMSGGRALRRAEAALQAGHLVPDRSVWPAAAGLPDLRLSEEERKRYDAQLGFVVDGARQHLDRSLTTVSAGSEDQSYIALHAGLMFPPSWTLDDVRLAAAHILRANERVLQPETSALPDPQPRLVQMHGLPRLPVEVTVRIAEDGRGVVLEITPAWPRFHELLAEVVGAAAIPAAQRELLPRSAHDVATLAFALAQIIDHPAVFHQVEADGGVAGGTVLADVYRGEYGGVRAGVMLIGDRIRYQIFSRAEDDRGGRRAQAANQSAAPGPAPQSEGMGSTPRSVGEAGLWSGNQTTDAASLRDLARPYRAVPKYQTGVDLIRPTLLNQPHLHEPIAALFEETATDRLHRPALIRAIEHAIAGNTESATSIIRDTRARLPAEQKLEWIDRIQQQLPTLTTTAQQALNNLLLELIQCTSPNGADPV